LLKDGERIAIFCIAPGYYGVSPAMLDKSGATKAHSKGRRGEGQLPENFPSTFCSLIYGSNERFVQRCRCVRGRFNMGGTGVLPFCGDDRKMQLIVSRVPSDVAESPHEWVTIFCFLCSKHSPSWKYLVGTDGKIMTAGAGPLGLVPRIGAKSGEVCAPRARGVPHGTLIKMYDYKAPRSNICGELFKKLEEYLLRPKLPLRIIECRPEYRANVMGVTVWDRFSAWAAVAERAEPQVVQPAAWRNTEEFTRTMLIRRSLFMTI
jgi:hypothetical protein